MVLNVLGDPAGDESLNSYHTGASNRIGFVGQAVGNVVSDEAGHLLGNWHVDQFNDHANVMDQGATSRSLRRRPGRRRRHADDPDVDFGEDEFNPNEGFTGMEGIPEPDRVRGDELI